MTSPSNKGRSPRCKVVLLPQWSVHHRVAPHPRSICRPLFSSRYILLQQAFFSYPQSFSSPHLRFLSTHQRSAQINMPATTYPAQPTTNDVPLVVAQQPMAKNTMSESSFPLFASAPSSRKVATDTRRHCYPRGRVSSV